MSILGLSQTAGVMLLLASFVAQTWAEEPFCEKIDLFKRGDLGYRLYHIPGIVVSAKGTALAWCEARKDGSDWDQIDILLRRSTDDGRTWSAPRKIVDLPGPKQKNPAALRLKDTNPNDVTYNNPVLIADRDGSLHMLFCLEYMRSFYQRSDDDGLTWQTSSEITKTFDGFRSRYDWKVLATGPNHGIQLKNGRLIVPVWLSTGTGGNAHRPSVTATIFSDDSGQTWRAGEIAVHGSDEVINPNESVAVELADETPGVNRDRKNMTVRVSEDEGEGWSRYCVIEPGWSAYSDLAVTPHGTILCFYGRGERASFAGDRLTVARFNREWMTANAAPASQALP